MICAHAADQTPQLHYHVDRSKDTFISRQRNSIADTMSFEPGGGGD